MVYGDFAVWFCCPMAVLTPDEVKALLACDAKFDWTDLSPEKVQQQVDKLNACLSLQAVYSIYQKPGDFVSIPLGVMHAVSICSFYLLLQSGLDNTSIGLYQDQQWHCLQNCLRLVPNRLFVTFLSNRKEKDGCLQIASKQSQLEQS